jgi:acetylornithine deacetylase
LLEQGVRADAAIVPEPYSTQNVITKHTGVMELGVHFRGRSRHISRKHEGVNAILKMAKAADALDRVAFTHEIDPDLPDLPLISVGTVRGGRGDDWEVRGANFVPDRCSLFLDVRFNQSMTPESVIADLRRVLDSIAGDDADFDYQLEYPLAPDYGLATQTMLPCSTDKDHPLVGTVVGNIRDLVGIEPTVGAVIPLSYAGNDTSHLYAAGIPCLLYGPGGGFTEDGDDRWTSVRQILDCTRVFAATIADVCA